MQYKTVFIEPVRCPFNATAVKYVIPGIENMLQYSFFPMRGIMLSSAA
jgi:hypothetical protein